MKTGGFPFSFFFFFINRVDLKLPGLNETGKKGKKTNRRKHVHGYQIKFPPQKKKLRRKTKTTMRKGEIFGRFHQMSLPSPLNSRFFIFFPRKSFGFRFVCYIQISELKNAKISRLGCNLIFHVCNHILTGNGWRLVDLT